MTRTELENLKAGDTVHWSPDGGATFIETAVTAVGERGVDEAGRAWAIVHVQANPSAAVSCTLVEGDHTLLRLAAPEAVAPPPVLEAAPEPELASAEAAPEAPAE